MADGRCRRSNNITSITSTSRTSSGDNYNNNNSNHSETRINAATTAPGGRNAAMAFVLAAVFATPLIGHASTRQKQPTKPRSKAIAASRLSIYSRAERQVGLGSITTDPADMVAASRVGSESGRSGVLPFKRCRLSPSPATGLVGMQANVFLNDYFGCLGCFPLATASMVRQATVHIMLAPTPQKCQQERCVAVGRPAGGDQGAFRNQREEWGWNQRSAKGDAVGDPSKCILWCTIAPRVLVQGCSAQFVSRLSLDSETTTAANV